MADLADLIIKRHAIDRYIERVNNVSRAQALEEILSSLRCAKEKHIRKIRPKKRTVIVPSDNCFFVFNGVKMVTCLERSSEPKDSSAHSQ